MIIPLYFACLSRLTLDVDQPHTTQTTPYRGHVTFWREALSLVSQKKKKVS